MPGDHCAGILSVPTRGGLEGQQLAEVLASLTSPRCRCQSRICARLRGTIERLGFLAFFFSFNCLLAFLPIACIVCSYLSLFSMGQWWFSYCQSFEQVRATSPSSLICIANTFLLNCHLYFNVVCGLLLYREFNVYGVKFVSLFLNGFWIMSCLEGPALSQDYDNSRLYFFLVLL